MLEPKTKLSRLLEECKNIKELKKIHCQILTSPYLRHYDRSSLVARLLFFCALSDLGSLSYATTVFRQIQDAKLFAYNIMIRAHACDINRDFRTGIYPSLVLYKEMLNNGVRPDCITFPFLVKECTRSSSSEVGSSLHGQVMKLGFQEDLFVGNNMVNFYSACGAVETARRVFDEMCDRDLVSWNSMVTGYLRCGELTAALCLFRKMGIKNIITWNSIITGFVQGGRSKEALELFHEMQMGSDALMPDKITVASALSACTSLGAIDHGKWVHAYLKRSGLKFDVVIGTALIDMYGKCGFVERAAEVFDEMPLKDLLAFTAMISAYALHGYCREAFDLLDELVSLGMKPNEVTFLALLSACAHAGLVERGCQCFDMMKYVYSVEPQVYHYACMVDIFSRAGLFEKAQELIKTMPMQPDVFVWGALLGGCQMHGNTVLGERVALCLIDLEPLNHAFYVILCDIYAKAGRFGDMKRIRAIMRGKRIKKVVPGCSMIELDGVVHEFSVRGYSEVEMEKVIRVLDWLSNELKVNRCFRDDNERAGEETQYVG